MGLAERDLAASYAAVGDIVKADRELVRAADLLPGDFEVQLKVIRILLSLSQFEEARARTERLIPDHTDNVSLQILHAYALAGLQDLDAAIDSAETAVELEPGRVSSYANLGRLQMAHGDLVGAERSLRQAIDAAPRDPRAHVALSNFLWATGRLPEAETQLHTALELAPNDTAASRNLAVLYLSTGRTKEAEKPLTAVSQAAGATAASRLMLADYYASTDRSAQASAILDELAKEPAVYARAKLRLALIAAAERQRPRAEAILNEILARDPKDAAALVAVSKMQLDDGKRPAAIETAKSAIQADSRFIPGHHQLARLYELQGDYDAAIASLNDVLTLAPRSVGTKLGVARLLIRKGAAREAVELLALLPADERTAESRVLLANAMLARGDQASAEAELAALQRDFPKNATVESAAGSLAARKNDSARARRLFSAALETEAVNHEALAGLLRLDLAEHQYDRGVSRMDVVVNAHNNDPVVRLLLARALMAKGDRARAESVLKETLTIAPNSIEGFALLGALYSQEGRTDEAIAQLDQLAAREPKPVAAHTLVGMLLEEKQRRPDAVARYRKALDLDPAAPVAANNLAWLYAEAGEHLDEALTLAQSAKSQLPDRAEIDDTVGWVYFKKGDFAMATDSFQDSIDASPDNPVFHYHLGLVYASKKDAPRARVELQRALALSARFRGAEQAQQMLQSLSR
jgi:putative PEP-CTERM system TPR-repeat lipoprotein